MRSVLLVKLSAPITALVAVGFLATTAINYVQSKGAISSSIKGQQVQAAEAIARNAGFWVRNRGLEVESWAKTDIYRKSLEDSFLGKTARNAADKRVGNANRPAFVRGQR